jgi:hypothetical protein
MSDFPEWLLWAKRLKDEHETLLEKLNSLVRDQQCLTEVQRTMLRSIAQIEAKNQDLEDCLAAIKEDSMLWNRLTSLEVENAALKRKNRTVTEEQRTLAAKVEAMREHQAATDTNLELLRQRHDKYGAETWKKLSEVAARAAPEVNVLNAQPFAAARNDNRRSRRCASLSPSQSPNRTTHRAAAASEIVPVADNSSIEPAQPAAAAEIKQPEAQGTTTTTTSATITDATATSLTPPTHHSHIAPESHPQGTQDLRAYLESSRAFLSEAQQREETAAVQAFLAGMASRHQRAALVSSLSARRRDAEEEGRSSPWKDLVEETQKMIGAAERRKRRPMRSLQVDALFAENGDEDWLR